MAAFNRFAGSSLLTGWLLLLIHFVHGSFAHASCCLGGSSPACSPDSWPPCFAHCELLRWLLAVTGYDSRVFVQGVSRASSIA